MDGPGCPAGPALLQEATVRRTLLLAGLGIVACLFATGCGSETGGGSGGSGPVLPPAICLAPGEGPYPLALADVTGDMGLGADALRATANNVTITDIDGDHWPDIMLTKGAPGGTNGRETPDTPLGLYHLYRNSSGTSFEDATWTSGLATARDGTPGRAISFVMWGDVNNDGSKDAFVAVYEDTKNSALLLDHSAIYLNNGDGTFSIGPDQRFTSAPRDPVAGAAFLDYDRNGLLDLWIGHHYATYGYPAAAVQDSLFAGDGLGNFFDVTVQAGLQTQPYSTATAAAGTNHKPTWGVTACDLDGDGWDDLMACSYGRQFNMLYRNRGDGTFEDLTMTSGFGSDANEDYSDNQFFRCYCDANPAAPDCAGVPAPSIGCDQTAWEPGTDDQPWRLGGNNSNAVCGDVDNDGDMDLLIVALAHWHIGQSSDKTELLINESFPAQPLARPGNETTGLVREHASGWNEGDLGGALIDFDNDGRLDVLVASSDYPDTFSLLWQQQADGKFVEVGQGAGVRIDRAHGLGVIDFDRDGDYDLVLGTSLARWAASDNPPAPDDAYAHLLRNDTGQGANKLMFSLIGAGTPGSANKDAVGARITVQAAGTTYVREVQGGYGLTGIQQDNLVILGIGASCTADQVTIRWPNAAGDEVSFTDVLANYVLVVEEGQPLVYQSLEQFAPRGQAAP